MLAMSLRVARPGNYDTITGVVWLAVLVTLGIRSNIAALLAGLFYTLLPGYVLAHFSGSWGNVPPVLFGLGAIGLAHGRDALSLLRPAEGQLFFGPLDDVDRRTIRYRGSHSPRRARRRVPLLGSFRRKRTRDERHDRWVQLRLDWF